jgi:hypothetical protein
MRRILLLFATMALAALMACAVALAQAPSGTLDANNLPGSTDLASFGTWILDDRTEFAQTFTAVESGKVTAAQARVVRHAEPPSDIVMKIASVTQNEFFEYVPDTVLATTRIPADQVPQAADVDGQEPTTAPLLTGTFGDPAQVVAGERYALIIDRTTSGTSGQDLWLVNDFDSPPYGGGEGWISLPPENGGGWMTADPDDFVFGIYLNGATAPADTTPPMVVSVSPLENATGVSRSTLIAATFSEAINLGSLSADTVKLDKVSAGKRGASPTYTPVRISGFSASTDAEGKTTISFRPVDANNSPVLLASRSTYRVTIIGVEDLASNTLDQDPKVSGNQGKGWTFTTGKK